MDSSFYVVVLILVNVIIWAILLMTPRIKHRNGIFLVLSFISLWIFLSIREPYSDMIVYRHFFELLEVDHFDSIFENRWEIFFKIFLYGIRLITNDPHIMFCIIAFVTLIVNILK